MEEESCCHTRLRRFTGSISFYLMDGLQFKHQVNDCTYVRARGGTLGGITKTGMKCLQPTFRAGLRVPVLNRMCRKCIS